MYITAYFWLYLGVVGLTLFMRTNNFLLLPAVVVFGVVFENIIMIGITALMETNVAIPASAFRIVMVQIAWAFFTGPVLIMVLKYMDDRWEKYVKSHQKEFA